MNSNSFSQITKKLQQLMIEASGIPERLLYNPCNTISVVRTRSSIAVNSEADMLSAPKQPLTLVIRSDTHKIYWFRGGDSRDRANYRMIVSNGRPVPVEMQALEIPTSEFSNGLVRLPQIGININQNEASRNPCTGCQNHHGMTWGRKKLVCAIHPYGWNDGNCPNYEPTN